MSGVAVAVIGAGMAGLTAALRLAERGFDVTVYEAEPEIGGQFGAHEHGDGHYHEHCYHMLLNWYGNFWQLARDVGLDPARDVEARNAVRFAAPGGGSPLTLNSPGAAAHVMGNLLSGVAPPSDMFLHVYSLIDLLSQRFDDDTLLDRYSVNGFMQSRPYASERSAELHDYSLAKAFASPSYLTSASSYQRFIKYGFRHPDPMMWVLRGDCHQSLHVPLRAKLIALGARVREGRRVTRVVFRASTAGGLRAARVVSEPSGAARPCLMGIPPRPVTRASPDRGHTEEQAVDYVVLAVPPRAIEAISAGAVLTDDWNGASELPAFRQSLPVGRKLKVEPMASLDLAFTRALPRLPKEHVVLLHARYGLTLIDNAQAWPGVEHTRLNVVASDFGALSNLAPDEQLAAMLGELKRYLPFDPARDLDRDRTHFQPNLGAELFVNEVGGERWRPRAPTAAANVFLAGDYCATVIDVVTIEGAVVSGLEAARALQARAAADLDLAGDDPRARPIPLVEPSAYSEEQMAALKWLLAPAAYVAKAWSWIDEQLAPSRDGSPRGPFEGVTAAVREPLRMVESGALMWLAPWAMAAEAWRTGVATWGRAAMTRRA